MTDLGIYPRPIDVRFAPMGSPLDPIPGQLCLDVGNRLAPGMIDHHQPDAPASCTAALVLEHPELTLSVVADLPPGEPLTIVTHQGPDLDAAAAVVLVERVLAGQVTAGARSLADYVCTIDRGETRLDPAKPITPYAVFLIRIRRAVGEDLDLDKASHAALAAGTGMVRWMLARFDAGVSPAELAVECAHSPDFAAECAAICMDLNRYRVDLARAERLTPALPAANGGLLAVPGLWIEHPEAWLFKSWARGDTGGAADPRGFVFLAVGYQGGRTILSVQPNVGVTLEGLGAVLEHAETMKRRLLGRERRGPARPGYGSPDPWYDGRSPLHRFSIVDSPHDGTVLTPVEVRAAFNAWLKGLSAPTKL